MHGERRVAIIDKQGSCKIYFKNFMPYNLYLEDNEEDIDTFVNNITNFYYWCSTRVLTLDRTYAKAIFNSIGVVQPTTDKDRAQIALSYHCLTLTDIFWVRQYGEKVTFSNINLYENHLDHAFVDVSLRGQQMIIQNASLIADDISTNGCFPKAWIRQQSHFLLLKGGEKQAVEKEIITSKICQCFPCNQVCYESYFYHGELVSISKIFTNLQYSIASREIFEIYAINKGTDINKYILKLDKFSFYMMNILDYLIGNTDRHWGNWGFLVDNKTNKPIRLHDLMDFNQSFQSYDTLDGSHCLTVSPRKLSQKEAAIEAVEKIGFHQISPIEESWFDGREDIYQMLLRRLELLK